MRMLTWAAAGVAAIVAAAPGTAAGWRGFRSDVGRFSVDLPGAPTYLQRRADEGRGLTSHLFLLKGPRTDAGDSGYLIAYVDVPPGSVRVFGSEALLNLARHGFLEGSAGRVLTEKWLRQHGRPARMLRIDAGGGRHAEMRSLMAGERLYLWMAAGDRAYVTSPASQRFLTSFRVAGAPPITKAAKPTRPAQPADPWRAQAPGGAGFRITAPGMLQAGPTRHSHAGETLEERRYAVDYRGESFRVSVRPAPPGDEDARGVLDAERDRHVRWLGGTLAADEPRQVAGNPGTQSRIVLPDSRSALVRIVLAGGKLFRLEVVSTADRSYSAEAMRFLDSFELSAGP
jgi:hypothetical protein